MRIPNLAAIDRSQTSNARCALQTISVLLPTFVVSPLMIEALGHSLDSLPRKARQILQL